MATQGSNKDTKKTNDGLTAGDANANSNEYPPAHPPSRAKHPKGDRSHIPSAAQSIVDILGPELARIKSVAPQAFKPQVDDMDKRINILFDHLNNEDLLSDETVQQMVEISRCVQGKEWDRASGLFGEMQGAKMEREGGVWMVSLEFWVVDVIGGDANVCYRLVSSDLSISERLRASRMGSRMEVGCQVQMCYREAASSVVASSMSSEHQIMPNDSYLTVRMQLQVKAMSSPLPHSPCPSTHKERRAFVL